MLIVALVCVRIICPYPSHFSQFGEHDHYSGVVFPQHPPEVLRSLCQWTLGGNVASLLPAHTHTHTHTHTLRRRHLLLLLPVSSSVKHQTEKGVRPQARRGTVKTCVYKHSECLNHQKGFSVRPLRRGEPRRVPRSETNSGNMYTVTTDLTGRDRWEHCGENLSDPFTRQAVIRGRGGRVILAFMGMKTYLYPSM